MRLKYCYLLFVYLRYIKYCKIHNISDNGICIDEESTGTYENCEISHTEYTGIYVDEKEIIKYGETLKKHIEELRIDIYKLADEEFNINSTKQLGEILFEKLKSYLLVLYLHLLLTYI